MAQPILSSFRNRLLLAFLTIAGMTLLLMGAGVYVQLRVRRIEALNQRMELAYRLQLTDYKHIYGFINRERSNSTFFRSHYSMYLQRHFRTLDSVAFITREVAVDKTLGQLANPDSVEKLIRYIELYRGQSNELVRLVIERGFKDYGAEGLMRQYAHELESKIPGAEVLMLRRHEKDFIIRKDSAYIRSFLQVADTLRRSLLANDTIQQLVDQYQAAFLQVADLESRIGVPGRMGILLDIEQMEDRMDVLFQHIKAGLLRDTGALIAQINLLFLVAAVFFLILIGLASIFLSGFLTTPLQELSENINTFIQKDFQGADLPPAPRNAPAELRQLFGNFHHLQNSIGQYIRELTRQKKIADQANSAKSLFLANMSHEIRTPLNGVLGITRLLQDTSPSPAQKEYLDILEISNQNLLHVINDILDFSKIEAGHIELNLQPFSPGEEVAKAYKMFQNKASNLGLTLLCEIDPLATSVVKGDAGRFSQIINNLLGNAIKFTEKGEVKIRLIHKGSAQGKERLCLEVKDTGIGISAEYQTRIFTPFAQADESSARKYGGTGLGLSIVSQLVHAMGGIIELESKTGEGSLFRVEIPFEPAGEQDILLSASVQPALQRPLRILLAEDNVVNQKVAKAMLQKMGHQVVIALNGQIAIDTVKSDTFDLILMDIQMPQKDGFEACLEIRAFEQMLQLPLTPVIAVTANNTLEDRERCMSVGMNGFLTKPLSPDRLQMSISQVLSQTTTPVS